MKKNCANCDAEFDTVDRTPRAITCSDECSKENRLRKNRWYMKNYVPKDEEVVRATKKRWKDKTRHIRNKYAHHGEIGDQSKAEKVCIICESSYIGHACSKTCSKACRNKHNYNRSKTHKSYSSPMVRLSARFRLGIRNVISGKNKKSNVWEYLSFTPDELMSQFESQFTDGMSWDNMDEWHIDHIRPVSSFNFDSTDHPDFKKCWALNNLQPLWAADNIRKRDMWDGKVNA